VTSAYHWPARGAAGPAGPGDAVLGDAVLGDHAGQPGAAYAGEPRFAGPVYPTPPDAPHSRSSRLLGRLADRAPRWSAPAAIGACFAAAASYVWISDPTDSGALDLPTCLVKMTTGLDCPGCGGTRAFFYLLHGNLPQAVRHHAVAVFAAPFLVWLYLGWSVRKVTGRSLPMPRLGGRTVAVFLAVWAAFMVVRNIPVAPFTYLYV
jgi:hypothetical protein